MRDQCDESQTGECLRGVQRIETLQICLNGVHSKCSSWSHYYRIFAFLSAFYLKHWCMSLPITFIQTMTHPYPSRRFVSFTLSFCIISLITSPRPIIFKLFIWLSIEFVIAIRRCVASAHTFWLVPMCFVTTEVPAVDTSAC